MSRAVIAHDREIVSAIPLVEDCLRQAVRRLRTRMLTRAGSDTPVRLVSTTLMTVAELLEWPEVRNGTAFTGFYVERGNVSGFSVIEGQLLERLTARLFGDFGAPNEGGISRGATDVELRVATRMSEEFFLAIEEYWPVRPAPRLIPRKSTSNRHGVADTPVASSVVVAVLECGPEDEPFGRLVTALPALLLRGVAGVVELPASARSTSQRPLDYDRVSGCEVEMVVELARLQSTLGTLSRLQIGDVLSLPMAAGANARVNGRPSFTGEPGACDGVRSFRVTRRVDPTLG